MADGSFRVDARPGGALLQPVARRQQLLDGVGHMPSVEVMIPTGNPQPVRGDHRVDIESKAAGPERTSHLEFEIRPGTAPSMRIGPTALWITLAAVSE